MNALDPIAFSLSMRHALNAALRAASQPGTVVITGEAGSGRKVLARFIHRASDRQPLPFTVIGCASLDFEALERALEHGGTVVVEELGGVPLELQTQLLVVLAQAHRSRVIVTCRADLAELVTGAVPLAMPPLRERREDLPVLAELVLEGRRLTGEALGVLESHRWPGNVGELTHVLTRAAGRAGGSLIEASDLRFKVRSVDQSIFPHHLPLDLAQLERLAIAEALRRTAGNRTHAARMLKIGLRTLRQKLNTPVSGELAAH